MKYCVVKRNVTFKSFLPIILILVLAVAVAFLLLMLHLFFFPYLALALGFFAAVFLAPRFLNTEYEYSIEGDEFSVALIMNKAARKEIFSSDMTRLISCGKGIERAQRRVRAAAGGDVYSAVFSDDDGQVCLLFTPTREFLEEMRLLAPSRVTL